MNSDYFQIYLSSFIYAEPLMARMILIFRYGPR